MSSKRECHIPQVRNLNLESPVLKTGAIETKKPELLSNHTSDAELEINTNFNTFKTSKVIKHR